MPDQGTNQTDQGDDLTDQGSSAIGAAPFSQVGRNALIAHDCGGFIGGDVRAGTPRELATPVVSAEYVSLFPFMLVRLLTPQLDGNAAAMDGEQKRISDRLWNDAIVPASYENGGEKYQAAILEQYKIYVEMADRVSQRRGLTNTFFLTLNSAIFTALAVFWQHPPRGSAWLLVFPLVIALGQCAAWWWLVRSYRQLNGAKFEVIGALEERLPSSPYWRAEWTALGEGRDWRKYLPLSHLEQWVPILFGLVYLVGFICVAAAGMGTPRTG